MGQYSIGIDEIILQATWIGCNRWIQFSAMTSDRNESENPFIIEKFHTNNSYTISIGFKCTVAYELAIGTNRKIYGKITKILINALFINANWEMMVGNVSTSYLILPNLSYLSILPILSYLTFLPIVYKLTYILYS